MTNTNRAGRGVLPVPRLSDPLLFKQEVNGIKTIGTSSSGTSNCRPSAQKSAQMTPAHGGWR